MVSTVAVLLCLPFPVPAQVAKLYPVDEAPREPSFFLFRSHLLQALQEHDEAFVLSVLSPDIKSSFGGDSGIEDFKSYWEFEQPDSQVWKALLTVLSLGGSFDGNGAFVAPYTFSKYPPDLDGYFHGIILGENVAVLAEPVAGSPVIATLSFDIVSQPDWNPVREASTGLEWIPIELAGGEQGFVPRDKLRSPIDYRAYFEKRDGKWMLAIFVAGD